MKKHKTRLIAKLDIKGTHLTKGIQYDGFRSLGDPAKYAEHYYKSGVDEIVLQDTVASLYEQNSLDSLLERIASEIFVPMTVGGGITSLERARQIFRLGADKISINTGAVKDIQLLSKIAEHFGNQAVVVSVDYYLHEDGTREIWTEFGRQTTGIKLEDWVKRLETVGVGEIFLSCINKDGTGRGYDQKVVPLVQGLTQLPLILAGGAGKLSHFDFLAKYDVNAVSVSSMLHYQAARRHSDLLTWTSAGTGNVEEGSYDFMTSGYGGLSVIPVEEVDVAALKQYISALGVSIRRTSEAHTL